MERVAFTHLKHNNIKSSSYLQAMHQKRLYYREFIVKIVEVSKSYGYICNDSIGQMHILEMNACHQDIWLKVIQIIIHY